MLAFSWPAECGRRRWQRPRADGRRISKSGCLVSCKFDFKNDYFSRILESFSDKSEFFENDNIIFVDLSRISQFSNSNFPLPVIVDDFCLGLVVDLDPSPRDFHLIVESREQRLTGDIVFALEE